MLELLKVKSYRSKLVKTTTKHCKLFTVEFTKELTGYHFGEEIEPSDFCLCDALSQKVFRVGS